MNRDNNKKQNAVFIVKSGESSYENIKVDDILEVKANKKIPDVEISSHFRIYQKKKKFRIGYKTILFILFLLCSIVLIFLKFILYDLFNEVYEKNLEELISRLCYAFIASYIFYTIVIQKSDKLKKKEAYSVICGILDSIVECGNGLTKSILLGAKKDFNIDILKFNDEEFKDLCSQVNLELIPEHSKVNISQLILHDGKYRMNIYIKKINEYMPFLEGQLINKISKIQNSKFSLFAVLIPYKEKPNLSEFSSELLEFLKQIGELNKLNNKLKRKYLKDYEKVAL